MKSRTKHILSAILSMSLSMAVFGNAKGLVHGADYGLYFNADKSDGQERTQCYINDGNAIEFKKEFSIGFKMMLRPHSNPFGVILHITLDNGQVIHLLHVTDNDDKNRPALVYNDALTYLPSKNLHEGKWIDISLAILPGKNNVKIHYADVDTTLVVPLSGAKSATVVMGRHLSYNSDIVPMIVKDVAVSTDGQSRYFWKFDKHNDDICLDSIKGAITMVKFPKWLIDSHHEWNLIYNDTISGNVDLALDSKKAEIYLIRENEVKVIDDSGNIAANLTTDGEAYIASSSGHSVFDPVTNELVYYSLSAQNANRFSISTQNWTTLDNQTDALHYNHARAYNAADSSYYFFGGYGHYSYRNDLYRLSPGNDKVERVDYENLIPPRFSAGMAAVNNKLYIIGGRGNEAGKQVLDSYYYYDLWEIDLSTLKAKKIWEKNVPKDEKGWMLASSIITLPDDNSLYALNMDNKGGTLMKFSMTDTTFTEVSSPIFNTDRYQDFDYSLYYAPEAQKFFMIVHKISVNKQHSISIYTLNTPLLHDNELRQTTNESKTFPDGIINLSISVAFLLSILFVVVYLRNRRKHKCKAESAEQNDLQESVTSTVVDTSIEAYSPIEQPLIEPDVYEQIQSEPAKKYYDASSSSIVLIGGFSVHDREGNDITMSFTPKLKELLLLLILACKKSKRGISVSKVTEEMWYDKEDSSARNNRNVSVRKLRVLLQCVGDIELTNQAGFMNLSIPSTVYCDYNELYNCADTLDNNPQQDVELYERILEILLAGALLPNSTYPWLDEYKSSYSSLSIDLLLNLLRKSQQVKNDNISLRIVRVMFIHDPLNEEALTAYCCILVQQGKRGIAKKVYDRFCREYEATMGEPFPYSFNDVLIGKCEDSI